MTNGNRTTFLPRGSVISLYARDLYLDPNDTTKSWISLSEHNRREFAVTINRIEKTSRMANGDLRKFFVADKREFSLSWDMLPGTRGYTVDGNWGALDLISFYNSLEGQGMFSIRVNLAKSGLDQSVSGFEKYTTATDESCKVSCTSFTATLIKRGEVPFYNISMTMEQV